MDITVLPIDLEPRESCREKVTFPNDPPGVHQVGRFYNNFPCKKSLTAEDESPDPFLTRGYRFLPIHRDSRNSFPERSFFQTIRNAKSLQLDAPG